MRKLALLATLALSSLATAQACGTLSISGSGAPRSSLTITMQGTPLSFAVLVVGDTAGTTSIPVGTATLDLGLAMPFAPYAIGFTDAAGNASSTLRVPANVPALDLLGQGVTATFPSLSFCTSNIVSFHVG